MQIKVKWEVEDGYMGRPRPQETIFDVTDYVIDEDEWNDLSEHDKNDYINQAVQEDFENKIGFSIYSAGSIQ